MEKGIRYKLVGLLVLLLLSACTGSSDGGQDVRTGTQGVEISLVSETPPENILLVSNEARGVVEPAPFEVDVRVQNLGASLAKGAVYVSGYDPSIIDFEGVDPSPSSFKDCDFNINNIGFGIFDGSVRCQNLDVGPLGETDVGISVGRGGVAIDFEGLDLSGILGNFGSAFLEKHGVDSSDLRIQIGGSGTRVDVQFQAAEFDPQFGVRGPFFLTLWSPIDFSINNGREFLLPGNTAAFPGGGEEFITFNGRVKDLPRGMERTNQHFMVTSCYLYATQINPTICIDTSPASQTEKTCRPAPYTSRRGQGGPVAVTSITQYPSTIYQVFTLTIENLGDGMVYDPTRITSCSPYYPLNTRPIDVNGVVLGMIYIGDKMLDCSFAYPHTVYLKNGKGDVTCWIEFADLQVQTNTGFRTPLIVELWYGYSETLRAEMNVQKIRRTGTERVGPTRLFEES